MRVRTQHGFSLIELLISLAIGSILLAVVTNSFINQRQVYATQEKVAEMLQNAMAGLDLLRRDVMSAGFDPTGTTGAGIEAASASGIRVSMNWNGDADLDDDDEKVTYVLADVDGDGDLDLRRNTDLIAENFESLAFTYTLADGTVTATPADLSQIRLVHVSLKARTSRPDPQYTANAGYRTHTLSMAMRPRNL